MVVAKNRLQIETQTQRHPETRERECRNTCALRVWKYLEVLQDQESLLGPIGKFKQNDFADHACITAL